MAKNKQDKRPNVPPLRFPEFTEPWEPSTLQEIAEFSKGTGISKEQRSETGLPCILYGELYTTYSNEVIEDVVSRTDLDPTDLVKSQSNDVIIPSSGETAEDIATARCVTDDNVLLGGDINIIRLNEPHDGRFMSYQLNGIRKYDIAKIAQGVSVVHLYSNELKKMSVSLPQSAEQKKIANFLGLLDRRIVIQSKLIEDLQQLKSAISTIIFSNLNYEIVKLGDICSITTGKLDANAMVDNGVYPFFTCAEQIYKIDTYSFDSEALLISGNGANVGYIHYYKGKFNAYQRTYVLSDFQVNIIYVKYFLDKYLHNRIEQEKNTGNTPYILMSTLSEMKINIPKSEQQNKIIEILTSISNKIEIEQQLLIRINLQKQYLLKVMFT